MKKIFFLFILLYSCNTNINESMKYGKYYAAHGFHNEYILLNRDSTYLHFIDNQCIDTSTWTIGKISGRLSLNSLTEPINWETGLPNINRVKGDRIFLRYKNGVLESGLEPLDYVHESMWDTTYHSRK